MKLRMSTMILALLAAALPAAAHPHVFIDNRITVTFDQAMLQGIGFQWTLRPDVLRHDPRRL